MAGFGALALVDDEFQLTSEERLKHSLDSPGARGALTTNQVNKVTKARIQYALAELAHNNTENVQKWLEEVAKDSPKNAIELYLELLQFTTPKIKAVAVDMRHTTEVNPQGMSLQQLQDMISGRDGSIVSSQ